MTFELSKNFHGVGIGPLSKILAVNNKSKAHLTLFFLEEDKEDEKKRVDTRLDIIKNKLRASKKLQIL